MTRFIQNLFSPAHRWKALSGLMVVISIAVLIGFQIQARIIESRIMTQEKIGQGWKAAGIVFTEHRIQQGENFWKVAKQYGVDIDTIVGANPGMEKLHASLGQTIRVPGSKGAVHTTIEQEDVHAIAARYGKPAEIIAEVNNLRPKHILVPGLELFIPGAKPAMLSGAMAAHYSLRGIFGSPLPGRITSGMGLRTHPIGGFRGRHTGVDLAASEGTRIVAAAAGTVIQTGEGEYIGKFVILSHDNAHATLYGHCSQILAGSGKTVKKGQVIAKVGQTGRTTGPHLHFEIRKGGVPQDPLKYLW
jgi:murein DD-endopeptidase MepM/ murein hydrolase activator NlpD